LLTLLICDLGFAPIDPRVELYNYDNNKFYPYIDPG
jgi:hypothetical protein